MSINTIDQKTRGTSGAIMMEEKPDNLTVMVNATVVRVLFNDTKATGIELEDGTQGSSIISLILTTLGHESD